MNKEILQGSRIQGFEFAGQLRSADALQTGQALEGGVGVQMLCHFVKGLALAQLRFHKKLDRGAAEQFLRTMIDKPRTIFFKVKQA
ncbi:hypothetical protein [Paenibacillus sp. YN15]|uniref:hypothetical protein n=1 Tax=Paenibacillus sp. YN15 TaxID=1742774 RepID=UPI000DCD3F64|nr:hypothetical protein [Paenibacillus sp. YN15]RAU90708.1 hypothetical protein DQG13_30260 [Paenibacillus sp. YN15]